MKVKSIVTAIAMAGTFGAIAVSATESGMITKAPEFELQQATDVKQVKNNKLKFKSKTQQQSIAQSAYFKANQHEGIKRYIVRLVDDSVPTYKGDLQGLDAVNKSTKKAGLTNQKFEKDSNSARKYESFLEQKQNSFVQKASSKIGKVIPELKRFKYAINGLVTELTQVEAQKLASMSEVAFVQQVEMHQLNTDTGPTLIGANTLWDGSANGTEYKGEGTVIGILDTGVNTDHRSFAATGDDGYTVVNPLGDGVYIGDCATTASLCNSKLIGVRSYSAVTDAYADEIFASDTRPANGEDYNGHGSHTASTSGGNVLSNVPYNINSFLDGNTGDGIDTSYTFTSMSGVAPHANIISYQVCLPGNTGDTYAGCPTDATLAAIDDAIADEVDVLNYSIGGSTPFDPWNSAVEIAFLSANAAGVFVATSAGNSGPDAKTTTKVSPWYTSVAAANHGNDRISGEGKAVGTFSGGDTAVPADIAGGGINGSFTGDIVYAGDFANPNDPDGDSAQCLEPFPAATFTATQIVVCDRGAIARVAKGANAAAGGAGGFILANIQGGSDTIADDYYAVPGIHINAANGDALKLWLSTGAGHQGTITSATLVRDTNTPDQIAGFSSRGPNDFGEIITPQVAAPGVSVYAAYSDDQPFNDQTGGTPSDFAFLQGTSMASPHVAGSAALISQAHPTWNPDQIRSALMMTATPVMLKEDGSTAADAWDMGAGRIQLGSAINSGLVMSETEANYTAASPNDGGDPTTLNVPSMASFNCASTCSWTRTFTAVNDGSYTLSVANSALSVEPANFDAIAGENYTVTVTADVSTMNTGVEIFDSLSMVVASQPDLHLPIYAQVNNGAVPESVNMRAGRNDGSWVVDGIRSFPTDSLSFTLDGLYDANATGFSATETFEIAEDPTNSDYKDVLADVFVYEFDVPANSVSLRVAITEATSPDFDLFLEIDTGGGDYGLVAYSATASTLESVVLADPDEGHYRIIVQNWAGSDAPEDTGTVTVNVVPQTDPMPGLTIEAPTSTDGIANVDVKFNWNFDMVPGDSFYGDVVVSAGEIEIGSFPITLDREADDISVTTDATLASRGDVIEYTLNINPSVYNQNQDLAISVDMPPNMTLVEGSIVASDGLFTVKDPNAVGLNLASDFDIPVDPTNNDYRDDLSQVHVYEFDVPPGTLSLTATISDSTSPDNDLFVEFDSAGDGSFATLVAYAATGATNESATAGSPAEGLYRVIIQNWAASSAASDTGVVTITTVPAAGEGFIYNVSSLAPIPSYSVVSSDVSDVCHNAGLGGWAGNPGYTPLSAFGIGTTGISGDEIAINALSTRSFPIFGNERQGLTISENGFVTFSGGVGANAWFNRPIPHASVPNDMFAGFWIDQVLVDDGTRGLRIANLGPMAIIDFDGLQSWTPDGVNSDRFKYQMQIFDSIQNETSGFGPYELIVSFAGDQTGSLAGATSGVENADGSHGTDASSLIAAGTQLCFDASEFSQGYQVTFSVVPTASYLGATAQPNVTVETDMSNTTDMMFSGTPVELVNVAPTANAGPDMTYDRNDAPHQIKLSASRTLDLDEDVMSYAWTQTSGKSVTLHSKGAIDAFFNFSEASNGTYTFNVDVSDGEFSSSDQVTITIEGEEPNSGVGAISLLLLLMGGSLYMRRRYFK